MAKVFGKKDRSRCRFCRHSSRFSGSRANAFGLCVTLC